jgi:hypothetical protein
MSVLEGHSVVSYRERLYIFGGRDNVTGRLLNTVWCLDFADIAQARSQRPEQSSALTAAADRRAMPPQEDPAARDGPPSSSRLNSSGAPATSASMSYAAARDKKEQVQAAAMRDEVERQSFAASFTNPMPVLVPRMLECTGHVPSPRTYHQCTLRGQFMLVTGGITAQDESNSSQGGAVTDDSYLRSDMVLWSLNLDTLTWNRYYLPGGTSTTPLYHGPPLPRCHASLVSTPDSALLFGGFPTDATAPPAPNHWGLFEITEDAEARAVPSAGESPSLWGHTAAFCHGCLFVFGGVDTTSMAEVNTLAVYSFDEHRWRWADFALAPEPRALHTCASDGSTMYVFGGFTGRPDRQLYPQLGDLWRFCLNTGLWEEVNGGGDVPNPRSGHASVLHDGILYVVAGLEGNASRLTGISTVAAFDTSARQWTVFRLLLDGSRQAAAAGKSFGTVDPHSAEALAADLLVDQSPPLAWPSLADHAATADRRRVDQPTGSPRTAAEWKLRGLEHAHGPRSQPSPPGRGDNGLPPSVGGLTAGQQFEQYAAMNQAWPPPANSWSPQGGSGFAAAVGGRGAASSVPREIPSAVQQAATSPAFAVRRSSMSPESPRRALADRSELEAYMAATAATIRNPSSVASPGGRRSPVGSSAIPSATAARGTPSPGASRGGGGGAPGRGEYVSPYAAAASRPTVTIESDYGQSPFANVANLVSRVRQAEEKSAYSAHDRRRDVGQWRDEVRGGLGITPAQGASIRLDELLGPDTDNARVPASAPAWGGDPTTKRRVSPSQQRGGSRERDAAQHFDSSATQAEFLARLERQRRRALESYSAGGGPGPGAGGAGEGGVGSGRSAAAGTRPPRDRLGAAGPPMAEDEPLSSAADRTDRRGALERWRNRHDAAGVGTSSSPTPGSQAHQRFQPVMRTPATSVFDDDADVPSWARASVHAAASPEQPRQHSVTAVRYGDHAASDHVAGFAGRAVSPFRPRGPGDDGFGSPVSRRRSGRDDYAPRASTERERMWTAPDVTTVPTSRLSRLN